MAFRTTVHVVFDTNAIWTGEPDQFFGFNTRKVLQAYPPGWPKPVKKPVKWYVPAVVRGERQYQMASVYEAFVKDVRKAQALMGRKLGFTAERIRSRLDRLWSGSSPSAASRCCRSSTAR